jgi:hypothetical protein
VPVDDTDNDDRFDSLCSIFPRLFRFHVAAGVERSHAERPEITRSEKPIEIGKIGQLNIGDGRSSRRKRRQT